MERIGHNFQCNYNPYETPPDFNFAMKHAKATLVNIQGEDDEYLKSEK